MWDAGLGRSGWCVRAYCVAYSIGFQLHWPVYGLALGALSDSVEARGSYGLPQPPKVVVLIGRACAWLRLKPSGYFNHQLAVPCYTQEGIITMAPLLLAGLPGIMRPAPKLGLLYPPALPCSPWMSGQA